MKKKIVIATGNQGKLKEFQHLLSDFNWELLPQTNFFKDEVDETGLSFIENAILKARFAAQKTGMMAIADDSGLEVMALQGEPGIYSARYSKDGTDESNNKKLLKEMHDMQNNKACYYCAIAMVRFANDPTPIIGLGAWCGEILKEPKGAGGFGYDPIFWLPSLNCSAAELNSDKKNKISHRAIAIKQFKLALSKVDF